MGYFSNGTEGMDYEDRYCSRCVHGDDPEKDHWCPVWSLHKDRNYAEANKKDSFLHELIPLSKDGLGNEQCLMFVAKAADGDLFEAAS